YRLSSRLVIVTFPYTTLFRSDVERRGGARLVNRDARGAIASIVIRITRIRCLRGVGTCVDWDGRVARWSVEPGYRLRDTRPDTQDRKSTRLNSSHLCISYADF